MQIDRFEINKVFELSKEGLKTRKAIEGALVRINQNYNK